jgi:hypothetical protein
MDANTPLWKAHDISQQLQDKIEVLPNVERAFVHVDHETTHAPVRTLSALTSPHLTFPFSLTGASEVHLIPSYDGKKNTVCNCGYHWAPKLSQSLLCRPFD